MTISATFQNRFSGHRSAVYCLFPGEEERSFYSGSGDGLVVYWQLDHPDSGIQVARIENQIFSLFLFREKPIMLLGQMDGGLHVLNLEQKKETRHLALHTNGLFAICEIDKWILTGGGDGFLCVLEKNSLNPVKKIKVSENSIRGLAVNPAGNFLAVSTSDNTCVILDTSNFEKLHVLHGHENSVFCAAFSPNNRFLITGSRDARLRVYDVNLAFTLIQTIDAHLFTINQIAFSPDGSFLATVSRDKTLKIWEGSTFELVKVLDKTKMEAHHNSVNCLLWRNEGKNLVTGSDDKTLISWQIDKP